jgi:hypothetical protein
MQLLGKDYIIWDKAAEIDFKKPGRGTVHSKIQITEDDLERIRRETAGGKTFLPEFRLQIVDGAGNVVARVKKTLYVREKGDRA